MSVLSNTSTYTLLVRPWSYGYTSLQGRLGNVVLLSMSMSLDKNLDYIVKKEQIWRSTHNLYFRYEFLIPRSLPELYACPGL